MASLDVCEGAQHIAASRETPSERLRRYSVVEDGMRHLAARCVTEPECRCAQASERIDLVLELMADVELRRERVNAGDCCVGNGACHDTDCPVRLKLIADREEASHAPEAGKAGRRPSGSDPTLAVIHPSGHSHHLATGPDIAALAKAQRAIETRDENGRLTGFARGALDRGADMRDEGDDLPDDERCRCCGTPLRQGDDRLCRDCACD